MKSVLIVEDDNLLGKAISSSLESEGFSIFWARKAEEVFEVFDAQDIGFVYLDILLPGEMDGYEILRKMKLDERLKKIPVVILSNLGQKSEIDRAMQLGAVDYLVKANIDLAKLVELTKTKIAK